MKHRKVIEKGTLLCGHVPYASVEDSGKLAVVNSDGEWDFGTGGSGGVFWVRMTTAGQEIDPDYGPYYVYSADKTAEEIKQAHDNGDEVLLIARDIEVASEQGPLGFDEAIVPLHDVNTSSGIICSFVINTFDIDDSTNVLKYTNYSIEIGKESGTAGKNYIEAHGAAYTVAVTPVEP